MGESLDSLPQLDGWLGITEAAEVLGISRQCSFRMAKRTNDGLDGGWQTIHQVGTKPHYLIRVDEVLARKQLAEAGEKIFGSIQLEDLDEGQPQGFQLSQRLINATSWRLAAELVRRNPYLLILETHPGGGSYDCLSICDGRDPKNTPPLADLNRAGSVHLFQHDQAQEHRLTWAEVLSAEQPRQVIEHIEHVLGLRPAPNAEATPRALAYGLISAVLTQNLNSPEVFDARNEFLDSSGDDTGWTENDDLRGYIKQFPSLTQRPDMEVEAPIELMPRLGTWREPYDHFWAVLRDERPILMVSIEGVVYTRQSAFQLSGLAVEVAGGMEALAATLIRQAASEQG